MSTLDDRSGRAEALAGLAPLFREILDLKRIRVAGRPGSLMEGVFSRSWSAFVTDEPPERVALRETALALAAVRLGGVDRATLTEHGLGEDEAGGVLQRALDEVVGVVDGTLARWLSGALLDEPASAGGWGPGFVEALCEQPRAGATAPGKPRIVLTPTESHGDHCGAVALFSVLLAPVFGAGVGPPFLAGLAHHLHNTTLPDAGHAGDVLLEEHLPALMEAATERAMEALPRGLRPQVQEALALTRHLDTPEAQAFHAADALDRVLELEWHARTAAFTLDRALDDLDLVHDGFTQAFQQDVLAEALGWSSAD